MNDCRLAPVALAALALACSTTNPPSPNQPKGGGLGEACSTAAPCRQGLACAAGTQVCVGAATAAVGARCTIGAECQSGSCGPNGARGACVASGAGAQGTGCAGDADCAAGLRCTFDGETLFARCLPSGTADVGAACTKDPDCAQALYCRSGQCVSQPLEASAAPKGFPPYYPSSSPGWAGADCPPLGTGAPTAMWSVPRPSDGPSLANDFYRLPYPNDAHRDAQGRIDFSRHPKDPSPPFGFDLLGRYLEKLATEPFSNSPSVVFRFDAALDFASLSGGGPQGRARYVDLTPGDRQDRALGLFYFLSGSRNRYVCGPWLSVRPPSGSPLAEGTYAVYLLQGLTDANGLEAKPSADLQAVLADAMPADAALQRAWSLYAPLRAHLARKGVPASQVLTASLFSVGDPQRLMRPLAQAVAQAPMPTAEAWVKCGSGPSPCTAGGPDGGLERACGTAATFDEWHTRLTLPIFQEGTAPHLTPEMGGGISASTTPVRTEQVCAALTVPKGQSPDGGWPVVLYAHGTGGSYRSHADDGAGQSLALAALPNVFGPQGIATLGFDQVGHGPRRGGRPEVSPDDVVYNFANPASARGTSAQGAADLHAVRRWLATQTGTGEVPLDGNRVALWGHSQGATAGTLFLAGDRTVNGALLSGASASLVDSLTSKQSPKDIAGGLWLAVSESSPAAVSEFHPVLGLLQSWSDVVDPLHFARPAVVTPAAGADPGFARHLFQVWGKGDTFTAQPVQLAFARAGGLRFVGPKVDEANLTEEQSASGNLTQPRTVTAAMRQYAPQGYDGHFVVYRHETARRDATRFLQRVLRGEVPTIPEP